MMTRDKEIDIIYVSQQQVTKTTAILKFGYSHVQIRAKTKYEQYDGTYLERLSKTKLLRAAYFWQMNDFT